MLTKFRFGGMNNVDDPTSVGIVPGMKAAGAYAECVDIVNCDVDNSLNAIRREGSTLSVAAAITSAWSNGVDAFAIINGKIHAYKDDDFVILGNSPEMWPQVEFCQMNDVVMFSDNTTIGYIQDDVPYTLNSPAEETDILDLETWVKLTYPAGAEAAESNFEIDAFKLATFAGKCLEFFNGAMYLAVDNFIFCTKTFNAASMDIRYNVVAGFKDPVTMIRSVASGLFVGTEGGTYFLSGSGVKGSGDGVQGFTQKQICPFGVIYGSDIAIPAEKAKTLQGGDMGAVWMSKGGIYAGVNGGAVKNLTADRLAMPNAATSAAMLRQVGELWQYVVSAAGAGITVNLGNAAHSRYIDFDFNGLLQIGSVYYGTNSDGLISLIGETDYSGNDVDAYMLTPVSDLGKPNAKRCPYAFLHVRTDGRMTVDLFVDESERTPGLPFVAPEFSTGAHRIRAKLPRGIKGTNWQFKVANVDGARFTAFSLEVDPDVLPRTI